MTEPTLQQLASEQQSQANFLEELAASLRSLQSAQEQERLQALLSNDTPLRMGAYPAGADVYPAGTTDPGATNIIADGSVTSSTIADGAVTLTELASGLKPPLVVSVLPSLPDPTNYPAGGGQLVFLTTTQLLYKTIDGNTWVKAVDGADITANSITAGQVAAGGLAAEIVLASIFKTAASGTRIEFDTNGLRAYNGSTLIVNIPTDGSNVYIAAAIDASSINVSGNASFSGTGNVLQPSSVLSLTVGINTPASAPSLAQDWDQTFTFDVSNAPRRALQYSATGGAGGATKVFWAPHGTTITSMVEYLASTGAVNRTLDVSAYLDSSGFVPNVVQHGTSIYVVGQAKTTLVMRVSKFAASNLAWQANYDAVSWPITPSGLAPILASDGTNIYAAMVDGADSNKVKWNAYDASMVKVGSTVISSATSLANLRGLCVGNADFGAWRLVAVGDNSAIAWVFNSTGVEQTNEEFPVPVGSPANGCYSITYGDAKGDGARFWSQGVYAGNVITKHTTWTWTTASSIYWVAYSWYDSNATGGTHETQCSPRASITMGRRKRLTVSTPTIPGAGGTDDPNNHRIYMLPNATDPGLTALKLQDTSAGATTILTTYTAAGAADPGSNTFPSGTPAQLQTASGGWVLKGNGLVNRTGTTFPASPATNDTYFRSDLGMEFYFDGTRWLSTQLFSEPLAIQNGLIPLTGNGSLYVVLNNGDFDAWIDRIYVSTLANATNNGTNYWTIKGSRGPSATAVGAQFTTAGDTAGTATFHTITVGALTGTADKWLELTVTKTGTPGSVYVWGKVQYRRVAT